MIAPVYRFGLGRLGAGPLTPLLNPSGGQLYSGGANFPDASTVELFQDNTGAIVDQNDNSMDPITGELYQDEISGPYTVGSPVASTSAATPSTPVAQVPSGSTLLYQAQWTAGIGSLTVTPNNVIQALSQQLPAHGMSVVSSSTTSGGPITYGIQVSVLDTVGNALLSDAQSVLDSIVNSATGGNKTNSGLSIVSSPSQAGNPAPVGYQYNSSGQLVPIVNSTGTVPTGTVPTWVWYVAAAGIAVAAVFAGKR